MKIYDENQFVPKNSLGLEDDPTEITLENQASIEKMLKPFIKLVENGLINADKQLSEALNIKGDETHISTKTKTAEVEYDEDTEYCSITIFKSIPIDNEITLNKGTKIRTLSNGDVDAYMSFYITPAGPKGLYKSIAAAVNKIGIKKLQDGFMKKHKKDHMTLQIKVVKNTVVLHMRGNNFY